MRSSWRQASAERAAVVAWVLLGHVACGSSEAEPEPGGGAGVETGTPAGGAGGQSSGASDGAEDPATGDGEGAAATMEGQDPSTIGNVEPPAAVPNAPAPAAPEPSAGCGQLVLASSGEQSVDVDGVARTFLLDLPTGYDGATPFPIVFAFHGATTSGEFFRSAFYGNLLSTMADNAIVVHPDALGDPTAWNTAADLPFFDAMLSELSATLCVDSARVFATGHSSGGFFTNTLGCQRGDVLRAIAPVSAGGPFTFGGNACTGEVAVWLAHAENDETVAFENGVDSRDRWLEANGCSEQTAPVTPEPCVEYSGCSVGLPVRWCVYQDGHNWPEFGPEGIWSFFSGF